MEDPIDRTRPPADADGSNTSVKETLEGELLGAKRGFVEARSDIKDKASELAVDAKDALVETATDAKHGLSGGLQTLGGALRAAGVHLGENGQPGPSKLIGDAASGLDQFAQSLDSKPLGEVIDELRTFGRNNAGGLFAGSVLAGLAFGRLIKTAEPAPTTSPPPAANRSPSLASGQDRFNASGENASQDSATDRGTFPGEQS
ncbi:hypothetical protein [Kaistia defluvii]|uniref:Nutrient deprivation-induced protein n=1 Tax=Kaistia defluvii TaxID=410841 RepID=A0ABV2R0Z5_9HYPH